MSKGHLNQDHEEPIETGDPNLWQFTDSGLTAREPEWDQKQALCM